MQIKLALAALLASMAVGASGANAAPSGSGESTHLNTNIAVLSSPEYMKDLARTQGLTVVDPSQLINGASQQQAQPNEIVEDPNDPFITTKSGKPRPTFVAASQNEWAETTISKPAAPLHRVKRCGGGGGGDGDAERARRTRRNRARRARRARARRARKAARENGETTTTVVRKVIQNGQVVSETVVPQASTTIQHQPVVQTVAAPHQPVVVQHQPVQQVVAQPAASPAAIAAPSISVQGSVKVN